MSRPRSARRVFDWCSSGHLWQQHLRLVTAFGGPSAGLTVRCRSDCASSNATLSVVRFLLVYQSRLYYRRCVGEGDVAGAWMLEQGHLRLLVALGEVWVPISFFRLSKNERIGEKCRGEPTFARMVDLVGLVLGVSRRWGMSR